MKKEKLPRGLISFIRDTIRNTEEVLPISQFDVRFTFSEENRMNESMEIAAAIHIDRRYLTARIKFHPPTIRLWKEGKRDDVSHIIIHELSHIVTQHFYDVATAIYKDEGEMKDAWETCTENISRLVERLDIKKR